MKIAVINPPRVNGFPVTREDRLEYIDYGEVFPPLTLLYTAAIVETMGKDVLMIDANGWDLSINEVSRKVKQFKPDILLTRFAIDTIPQDSQVVKIAKKVNPKCITLVRSKIIMDSVLLQKEVFTKYPIDFLITGDMEVVIPDLINNLDKKADLKKVRGLMYYKNGKSYLTGKANGIKNINNLPYPAYHLSGGISCYRTGTQTPPFTNIFSSRGCPYHCKFCSSHDTYQARTPKNVVDELEWLVKTYKIKNFYFFDDIFTIKQDRAEQICQEIIKRKLKLRWSCGTRVDCVNPKLLTTMKKSGCWMIAFGVESGNQEILDKNAKGFSLTQAEKAIKQTQNVGIAAYAMFVLGLPGETKATLKNTFKFVNKINPDYAQYCVAVPFPNTPFFDEYHKNGWITNYDWTKYNPLGHSVISTPEITARELNNYHFHGYRSFLLRPKFLISRINLRNWEWNIAGIRFLSNRIYAITKRTLIR
jgi:anaerobic magnesium-protoporphyrin IX monomethyl ester cyclase